MQAHTMDNDLTMVEVGQLMNKKEEHWLSSLLL